MNELEQARQVLAKADAVLEESIANLEKSQTFNEVMVEQNRRLSFALSNLLPKQYVVNLNTDQESQLTELAKNMKSGSFEVAAAELADSFKQREAFDIVHAINVLAMANTDVIHIFTRYSGHVNVFNIDASPVNSKYEDDQDKLLVTQRVYLKHDDALEKLLSIESQLTDLIIEAREEAEEKVEVEA